MQLTAVIRCSLAPFALLLLALCTKADDDKQWIDLTSTAKAREAWDGLNSQWNACSDVELDAKNARRLSAKAGEGTLVNEPKGRAPNLITKQKFTDVDVHVEFNISKGSNSGVKLMGIYEIQIYDSNAVKEPTGEHCGGIYPRAEDSPRYKYLDKGVPPRVNAAKPAGEWQTLDITFRAPRFDADGKKTSKARFVKVVLNGQVIHENVDVDYATGAAWNRVKERPTGPLLLQGDHGPVAFRNVRIRPLPEEAAK